MRVLALDVGDRRIGVAVSDTLGLTAQRLTVVARRGLTEDLEQVRTLVSTHQVGTIVVGLPLTTGGERGRQAQKVLAFSNALTRQCAVPVQLVDERFTTLQGQRALAEAGTPSRKRKALIDQVAAQLILQQFLDAQRAAR